MNRICIIVFTKLIVFIALPELATGLNSSFELNTAFDPLWVFHLLMAHVSKHVTQDRINIIFYSSDPYTKTTESNIPISDMISIHF